MKTLTCTILVAAGLLLAAAAPGEARHVFQLGGAGGEGWASRGVLTFADATSVAGSLRPLETDLTMNLAPDGPLRGGGISSIPDTYTLPSNWFDDKDLMADGDSLSAFLCPPLPDKFRPGNYYSVAIFMDLGAPFPVERIRFFTRPDHPENLIRQYDLFLNDGSAAALTQYGDPIWSLLRHETDNLHRVVDLSIARQPVRRLYLHPGSWGAGSANTGPGDPWEVAELEVYGRGYVPSSGYLTQPIDLGRPSALGEVRWAARRDPGAKVVIQSRSGSDGQPEVYWRRTGVGDEVSSLGANGRPLTEADYEGLAPTARGGITQDLDSWSVWHTYELEDGLDGTRILSPSPRRYVQFRVDFQSSGLAGSQIDSLRFEYSQPPVADAAVAEIWPAVVEPGERVRFTYAVRAQIGAGQSGFSALEVRTPALVDTVEGVRIDGAPVGFTPTRDAEGFSVTFPRIDVDQTLLEVDFTAQVFRYGTPFSGAVRDAEVDEVPLEVIAGDAVAAALGDALKVKTSLGSHLLGGVQVSSNPFSPNGDGVNDAAKISFQVLSLTTATDAMVEIFDLAGRRVRVLRHQSLGAGVVEVTWDGLDDAARAVTPGSYIYRIGVDADGGEEVRVGPIAVAY
ncbi:MAG: FlgD immunoglobulin-like domain containing protein [Gemmatimonadota bacterium]